MQCKKKLYIAVWTSTPNRRELSITKEQKESQSIESTENNKGKERMENTTNKTITILLIATIAVSLGGTLLSLGKLQKIQLATITGYDTLSQEGSVDATITSNTAINLTVHRLNFGSGTVDPTCNNCTMHTPSVTDSTCCNGFSAPATGLRVENVGNRNVTLNASLTDNASTFIGGTNPIYQVNKTELETGSCNDTSGSSWGSWGDLDIGEARLCDNLYPTQANDELELHIKLRIPDNSKTGLLNTSFNLTATTLS